MRISEFTNDADALAQSAKINEMNKFRPIQNFTFFEIVDVSTTSFLLRNLQHFSMYTISVKACREEVDPKNSKSEISNCSNAAFVNQRTQAIRKFFFRLPNNFGNLIFFSSFSQCK